MTIFYFLTKLRSLWLEPFVEEKIELFSPLKMRDFVKAFYDHNLEQLGEGKISKEIFDSIPPFDKLFQETNT